MSEGIRATVEFQSVPSCEIARISETTESTVESVWTSVPPADSVGGVSEFMLEAEEPPATDGVDHVMSLGGRHLLRLDHGTGVTCPCECLGQFGCPVQRYVARSGRLRLVFNAADFEELQTVVADLRERFPDLDVRRLVRSPDDEAPPDAVYVDRSKLTDRQLQVLQTAYRMGYFERPRRANATEIAAELDVDPSTFNEHLVSAQRKLVGDVLEERS